MLASEVESQGLHQNEPQNSLAGSKPKQVEVLLQGLRSSLTIVFAFYFVVYVVNMIEYVYPTHPNQYGRQSPIQAFVAYFYMKTLIAIL